MRIPFLLYGDGPRLSTGLARIARDLAIRLVAEEEQLGIRFAQVGVDYPGGWQWQAWDLCGFQPNPKDQGRDAVEACLLELNQACGRSGVCLMIMDPARCYDLTRPSPPGPTEGDRGEVLPAQFWGYYPLDAHNRLGAVGGPAARAILDTDRLLGYGRWGAQVLQATRSLQGPRFGEAPARTPIAYLPHGIDTMAWRPTELALADPTFQQWAAGVPPSAIKIGAVATNQPRKDLGLLFAAVAELKAAGEQVAVWLHTDALTAVWDIGELAYTCGLGKAEVAASIEQLSDQQLAARYTWSDVTLAPGLGEGYGYPIVESLSCGTPCVHGKYAGGVELIPDPSFLVTPWAWRLESVYALQRPVFKPGDVAGALWNAAQRTREQHQLTEAYCRGAVQYLDWQHLWPRWRQWIRHGLEQL